MKYTPTLALRQERERRGWSRNYVAEQVEVDVITVGRWERGERMPHPHHRQKLCTLFEMNAQELGLLSMPLQELDTTTVMLDQSTEIPSTTDITSSDPSGTSDTIITVTPSNNAQAIKAASPLFHDRRKILVAGLGGLGVLATIGSGIFLTSRSAPASAFTIPIPMPLSRRYHHLIDPNTDNYVNYMAWSPDNSDLAVATGSNIISIWNIEKAILIQYYPTLNAWVNDISWSKTNVLAAVTADLHASGSLQLWKFPDKMPLLTLQRPYALRSVCWSPNNRYLAFSGHTSIVEVWDPFTSHMVSQYSDASLAPLLLGIRRVKWSASGKFLACGADDGTVHIWEALTGKPKIICYGHKSRVIDLSWSPDERYIVSASADKTSRVWETSSGRSVLTYRGHTGEVEGVDWSPNGTYIASGSDDRTAHIWEALTGRLITKYGGHSSAVETVLWSEDESILAIGTEKEGVEIWQAPFM